MELKNKIAMSAAMDIGKKVLIWISLYLLGYYGWHFLVFIIVATYIAVSVMDGGSVELLKRKLVPELPDWILKPDLEKVEWANEITKQLWPHCQGYLKQLLDSVENDQTLKTRLAGYNVKSLRFTSLNFGKIPPTLSGIKIQNSAAFLYGKKDEIVLDLAMNYAGDLVIEVEFQLDTSFFGLSTPTLVARIKNIGLSSSCVRLHLRPLLSTSPFVGSATISFMEKPVFDFDLDGLAPFKLLNVQNLIRHLIHDQLEETIVMPNSVTFSLAQKSIISDKVEKPKPVVQIGMPAGVLNVNIIEAKGLEDKDHAMLGQGKSDPYAILRITADNDTSTFKTHVVDNNLHPVWNMSGE